MCVDLEAGVGGEWGERVVEGREALFNYTVQLALGSGIYLA